MRRHYFNPELAADLGVNTAVVYQFVADACKANATPWTQQHDGRFWVAFPQSRFVDVFPYMAESTVRVHLKDLESYGLIESACFDTYTKCIKSYSPTSDDRFDDFGESDEYHTQTTSTK